MYIVYLVSVYDNSKDVCVVANTKEKAQEYINKEVGDNALSGICFYKIEFVKFYG